MSIYSNNIALITAAVLFVCHCEPTVAFQWLPSRYQCRNTKADTASLNALSRREYVVSTLITIASIRAQPALALLDKKTFHLNYQGLYTDPNHPKGYRVLTGNAQTANLRLQDDPSDKVYNLPIQVETASDGTLKRFAFDFSPKGGPVNIIGILTKDKEGIPIITFADGNTWKKRETGPIGVYQHEFDPERTIVIRQSKGSEWTVHIIKGEDVTSGSAKAGNPTIIFHLPGGDDGVAGVFSTKLKTITFDDGNVWTKF
ncbi:hypothetical protein ACHAW6_011377 [Cyclotella cf. meneghiniana]